MQQYASPRSDDLGAEPEIRTYELRGMDVVSAGRLMAGLYGGIALVFGGIYGAFLLVASIAGAAIQGDPSMLAGGIVALVIVVMFPFIYAFFGFIGGLLMAAIYNFVAGRLGGLDLRLVAKG